MGNSQGKDASVEPAKMPEPQNPYVQKILDAREKLTGWERLQLIFTTDEFGSYSPEVSRILHTFCISLTVGGLLGAMGRGRIAHMDFMRSNAHEMFESPLQAKRKLQDNVTIGMFSGAWRIGWRLTLFTTTYMAVATMISTYRGKMGVMDQVAGAGFAGFLYKFPQGPKAQVAGATVGSMLGLGAGILTLGITKLTGQSIDSANLKYYEYLSKKEESRVIQNKSDRELLRKIDRPLQFTEEVENDNLQRFHDQLIAALEEKRQKSNDESSDSAIQSTSTDTKTVTKSVVPANSDKVVESKSVSDEMVIMSKSRIDSVSGSGNNSSAKQALSVSGKT